MLDYDKKFLLKSADNLTFDGSSIRGFTPQRESDLRLALDWGAFYWGPADIFGAGKVLVFGDVLDRDGTPFSGRHPRRAQEALDRPVREERLHAQRGQRDRRLPVPRARRRAALSRDRQVRVRQHRRLLPLAARRSAARRSSTRSPKCSARWASRTRRTIPRSRRRSSRSTTATAKWPRPPTDPALQADLPPSRDAARHDGELPAQAGRRRERQRHAHQRLGQQRTARTCSGIRRAEEQPQHVRLGLRRPHPHRTATTSA